MFYWAQFFVNFVNTAFDMGEIITWELGTDFAVKMKYWECVMSFAIV